MTRAAIKSLLQNQAAEEEGREGEGGREREGERERGRGREREKERDRKSTRLNSSHVRTSRMPSSA